MRVSLWTDGKGRRKAGRILVAEFDPQGRPVEALVLSEEGEHLVFGFDEANGFRFASCIDFRSERWGDSLQTAWTVLEQHPSDAPHTLYIAHDAHLCIMGENDSHLDTHLLGLMGWLVVRELASDPFDGTYDGAMAVTCPACGVLPAEHPCAHVHARETENQAHNRRLIAAAQSRRTVACREAL